jgi:hypothetical protein
MIRQLVKIEPAIWIGLRNIGARPRKTVTNALSDSALMKQIRRSPAQSWLNRPALVGLWSNLGVRVQRPPVHRWRRTRGVDTLSSVAISARTRDSANETPFPQIAFAGSGLPRGERL